MERMVKFFTRPFKINLGKELIIMPFEQERELLEKSSQRLNEFDPSYVVQKDNKIIIGGQIALSIVLGDNIIVLEDQYKDPYACDKCNDIKKIKINCSRCDGKGKNRFENACSDCAGKGQVEVICQACKGRIIIPDQAKARPTSGRIVCIGPEVRVYNVNDRVAYSGYTGHLIPFKGNTRLRIMTEREPFCLVENVSSGTGVKVEFIDKDTAYDLL
jgi:co-chaperonin GroES (HSP10)